jgi:FkbM family methyltransferase
MNLNNYQQEVHLTDVEIGNIKSFYTPKADKQTLGLILHDWFETIRPYIKENNLNNETAIQAGGNFGVYPLLMTELYSTVYTFEPDPLNFYCLVNNCQFDNIIKFNTALSDKPETLYINVVQDINRGMNKVSDKSNNKHFITAINLDSINIENVKLIQLDVEGFENKAINGAKNIIMRDKPTIILECGDDNNPNDSTHIKEVIENMKTLDYKIDKRLNRLDIAFIPN